jgi:hypothetical protein
MNKHHAKLLDNMICNRNSTNLGAGSGKYPHPKQSLSDSKFKNSIIQFHALTVFLIVLYHCAVGTAIQGPIFRNTRTTDMNNRNPAIAAFHPWNLER